MKRATTLFLTGAALVLLAAPQAKAQTFTYGDNWVNWPGYTSSLDDENGWPKIDHMDVTISSIGNNNYLDKVSIVLHNSTTRLSFDSLFISTGGAWDSWDYFVHNGGNQNTAHTDGDVPTTDGLYKVDSDYTYTYVKDYYRIGNPNGIDANDLTLIDDSFEATQNGLQILYDFSNLTDKISIDPDDFFVAYAPYCDNDIIGGGTAPVPEPATMLLFGTGLAGLATIGRKKMKRD